MYHNNIQFHQFNKYIDCGVIDVDGELVHPALALGHPQGIHLLHHGLQLLLHLPVLGSEIAIFLSI